MKRIIIIQDDDYERQADESQRAMDRKYHEHPTKLRPMPEVNIPAIRIPARPPKVTVRTVI